MDYESHSWVCETRQPRKKDLYVGVPAIIGSKGVERIVEIQLNGNERAMFEKSAGAVKTLVDACMTIAPNLGKGK